MEVEADLVVGGSGDVNEAEEGTEGFGFAGRVDGTLCFGSGFFLGRPRPGLAAKESAEEDLERGKDF